MALRTLFMLLIDDVVMCAWRDGDAVPAGQNLSALIYANMKIGDIPDFAVGILNFSYHGWLQSRMCLRDQLFIQSLDPET